MPVLAWHEYINPEVDLGNPNETGPAEWNAGHPITALGPCLLGVAIDTGTEVGTVEEITLGIGFVLDPEYAILTFDVATALGYTPFDAANVDTSPDLDGGGASDAKVPSQLAVKTYVDNEIAGVGGSAITPFNFTGDGSTTVFDLTDEIPSLTAIGDAANVVWFEDGIWQRPGVDYTVSGTEVTRTTAPLNGAVISGVLFENLASYSAAPFDVDDLTNINSAAREFLSSGSLSGATRELLTANRTYYVRTDGSNSNTGLVDNAGGAFLTIQKAWDTILTIDLNGFTATINVGTGTFTAGISITSANVGGNVILNGNGAANTIISTTSARCIGLNAAPVKLTVQNIKLTSSASDAILVQAGQLTIGAGVEFGACTSGRHLWAVGANAVINGSSAYTISGGAVVHSYSQLGAMIEIASNTITVSGTPAFSSNFAFAESGSLQSWFSNTFSGSATGTRYTVNLNAVITTYGGGANYFPGNAAGSTATGGQYA